MKIYSKAKALHMKILSVILCVLLSFSCVFLSACVDFEDEMGEQTKSFFQQYIDGFKVVYSSSLEGGESSLIPLENTFFNIILGVINQDNKGLSYYYGSANSGAVADNHWFPDSIRMFVIKNTQGKAVIDSNGPIWKWTFSQTLLGNDIKAPSADQDYEDWKDKLWNDPLGRAFNELYSQTFTDMYILPLKIVMYEILLGYDNLTTFTPDSTGLIARVSSSPRITFSSEEQRLIVNSQGKATVYENQEANEADPYAEDPNDYLVDGPIKSYIANLKNEFLQKTKYIGFTKTNADKLIDYILDEVIGTNLVNYDYMTYYNTVNYRNYVKRVAEVIYSQTYDGSADYVYRREIKNGATTVATIEFDAEAEGLDPNTAEFSAKPATFMQDFAGETFFEDENAIGAGDSVYSYGSSPKAEYQSILMLINDERPFELEAGMAFNILGYDQNLQIRIKVRYYNHELDEVIEFDSDHVTFTDATVVYDPTPGVMRNGYETDFEVGFDVDRIPDSAKGKTSDGYDTFIIPPVTNNDFWEDFEDLDSNTEVNLGESDNSKYATYYKVIDSANGYGGLTVLDESRMQCSFYEIVFDVVKRPTDPPTMDYTFKITISPAIW